MGRLAAAATTATPFAPLTLLSPAQGLPVPAETAEALRRVADALDAMAGGSAAVPTPVPTPVPARDQAPAEPAKESKRKKKEVEKRKEGEKQRGKKGAT